MRGAYALLQAYDLTYHTSLNYHYAGGICLAALKRFREAEDFLEIVVSSPAQGPPAALQLDALNKLALIQLLVYGRAGATPRYTHPTLARIFKASPYHALAKAYPAPASALIALAEKDAKTFSADGNVGLVRQALARAPRWAVRKLTETYVTLALPEIGKAVGIESEAEVRAMVLSMVRPRAAPRAFLCSRSGTDRGGRDTRDAQRRGHGHVPRPTHIIHQGRHRVPPRGRSDARPAPRRLRPRARAQPRLPPEGTRPDPIIPAADAVLQAVREREGTGPWMMDEMDMGGHGLREAIWDEGDF